MNEENSICDSALDCTIGWWCLCWCDTYWEPEGIVLFPYEKPPVVGAIVKLSDGKNWTVTSINPEEMEIKVELR